MSSLRAHLGRPCPHCRRDILQMEPSNNRMPDDKAWCPACQTRFTSADLDRPQRGPAGLLKRLFGRGNPQ